MKDPFFLAPIPWLSNWVQPWADRFNLPALPVHIHEVVFSALLYSVVYYPISPFISNLLASRSYNKLSRNRRLNWDAHVVSMVQAIFINALTLWVMAVDDERKQMDQEERVWGYTGAGGYVQSMAAGYFMWDFIVTGLHVDVFGPGTLAHAFAALIVYSFGFRPFLNYYACNFILWELSTPFLNIHWFLDKIDMTGSRIQLYNGILLLFTFFSTRLVYGTYQSFCAFSDIWQVVNVHISMEKRSSPLMLFATDQSVVPVWLALLYLASNLTLNGLNVYWFFMMIRAVRKRFVPAKQPHAEKSAIDAPATEADVDLSSIAPGVAKSQVPSASRRRRA